MKKKKVFFNKKVSYNFIIEKTITAGLVLQGWEVKSIRAGYVQITAGYIIINRNEIYLIGTYIQPLANTTNFSLCQTDRIRKLLLTKKEIEIIMLYNTKKGYTIIPLKIFWNKSWCKIQIGIAKGKSTHDKRLDKKNRAWKIEQSAIYKRISLNNKYN
ncbi:SsrA-binding protein SmpB [Buchnera aphidicola]|uniref:SsrA-binding protein SmpB n=1 Tax=Buchnera aphidicola TaxID=9 RepID=UPI0022B29401|nr:SsrA-binding protein SmpB [Buchnera aphidicola]